MTQEWEEYLLRRRTQNIEPLYSSSPFGQWLTQEIESSFRPLHDEGLGYLLHQLPTFSSITDPGQYTAQLTGVLLGIKLHNLHSEDIHPGHVDSLPNTTTLDFHKPADKKKYIGRMEKGYPEIYAAIMTRKVPGQNIDFPLSFAIEDVLFGAAIASGIKEVVRRNYRELRTHQTQVTLLIDSSYKIITK